MAKSIAGYSGTPLIRKLGLLEDMRVLILNPPADYFELLGKDISAQYATKGERPDFVHLFAKSGKVFEAGMPAIKKNLKPTTIIWVSWYKKSAGIPTDIGEDDIRAYALKNNLVDVKVCAVDEKWSGLKLVIPLAKRALFF